MLPIDTATEVLANNVNSLLEAYPHKAPRPQMAAKIGIGDKTLGFLKAGSGNPTLESIVKVARFFRIQPWELLKPQESARSTAIDQLMSLATPRSKAALQAISKAAEQGALTEHDLLLLQRIAERFMER